MCSTSPWGARSSAGAWGAAQGLLVAGLVAFALVASAAGAGAADAAEVPRIGVVDMQKVILESAKGQRARAQLQKETEAKQKDMNGREEEIRKLQADLERQRAVLSPTALKEKEDAIQRKIRDIRRIAEDSQRDLTKREGELVGEIQREAAQVIGEYGKEKGFQMVLERSAGVWYASERADVTKEIIDRFNAKAK
jgi:outer membrane protein